MATNDIKPRLCSLKRNEQGYGFHLFGAKDKKGHIIRKVEEGSVAELSGLLVSDRIIEVNSINVQNMSHKQVVEIIKSNPDETNLLVVTEEEETRAKEEGITITAGMVENVDKVEEVVEPSEPELEDPVPQKAPEKEPEVPVEPTPEEPTPPSDGPRPRLCKLTKGEGGYGFNLHSDKGSKTKSVVSNIVEGGVADKAGMKLNDRVIEVNGENVEALSHEKTIRKIKDSGDDVTFLLVDPPTDIHFLKCGVTPSSVHLDGELPQVKQIQEETLEEISDGKSASTNEMLSMDLNALKARVKSNKKQAPTTNWNDRKALFNKF